MWLGPLHYIAKRFIDKLWSHIFAKYFTIVKPLRIMRSHADVSKPNFPYIFYSII